MSKESFCPLRANQKEELPGEEQGGEEEEEEGERRGVKIQGAARGKERRTSSWKLTWPGGSPSVQQIVVCDHLCHNLCRYLKVLINRVY